MQGEKGQPRIDLPQSGRRELVFQFRKILFTSRNNATLLNMSNEIIDMKMWVKIPIQTNRVCAVIPHGHAPEYFDSEKAAREHIVSKCKADYHFLARAIFLRINLGNFELLPMTGLNN